MLGDEKKTCQFTVFSAWYDGRAHVIFLSHAANFDPEQLEPGSPVRRATEQVPKVVHEEIHFVEEVEIRVETLEGGLEYQLDPDLRET